MDPVKFGAPNAIQQCEAGQTKSKTDPAAQRDTFAQKHRRSNGGQDRLEAHEHRGIPCGPQRVAIDLQSLADHKDHHPHGQGT